MKIKDLKRPMGWVEGTDWLGGSVFAVLFTLLEFLGAFALIIGFLTQVVAVLFVLELIATSVFSKRSSGRSSSSGTSLTWSTSCSR